MRPFPDDSALAAAFPLPEGVTLTRLTPAATRGLAARLLAWYPAVAVGAESVFVDDARLRALAEDRDGPFLPLAVHRDGALIGLQIFERQEEAGTLHARLGLLDPAARLGVLGALGFPLFVAVGRLVEADLLLAWVTLAGKIQQLAAERAGFALCGIVPAFDRDARSDGPPLRVAEALYAKVLAPASAQLAPAWGDLTATTRRALAALHPGLTPREPTKKPAGP